MIEINNKFIEELLQKYNNDTSLNVTKINITPACGKGENFMSVVLRISVEATRKENNQKTDFKTSLIAKRPYQSELLQEAYNTNEIFLNEVVAYNEIIPTLQKYSKIKLPVADCLFAEKELIILEDLSARNFEMRRNQVSMSIEQCLAVVQELAIFHSASIILKKENAEKLKSLSNKIMEIYREDNKAIIDLVEKNFSVALTLLRSSEQTPQIIKAIDVLEKQKNNIYPRVCNLIKIKKETSVLNHGDCWMNNILLQNSINGFKVKLIDLQVMRFTSPAADLNYFLHINLTPEERNKNIDLLLNKYLNTLHNCLRDHQNLDAVNNLLYSTSWLEKEMSEFQVFGFMSSLWISPAFYIDKNKMPDMETIKPEEMAGDYHKEFILKHMTTDLKERIISIILDFVNSDTNF